MREHSREMLEIWYDDPEFSRQMPGMGNMRFVCLRLVHLGPQVISLICV